MVDTLLCIKRNYSHFFQKLIQLSAKMTLSNGDGDVPGPSSASAACIPPPLSASVDPSRHGNANTFRMIGIVALIAVVMLVGVVVGE